MTEPELNTRLQTITPPDEAARAAAHAHWAALAKPLGGLGSLETMLEDAAALTGTPELDFARRAVLVLCADNGVVAQGVSHLGQSAAVFLLYISGKGSVSTLQALPDLFQWVGPDAVVQLVFPGIIPLCQRGMLRADQHCLDAGRAEFDAESCLFRYKVGHIAGLLFGKRNAVFLIC